MESFYKEFSQEECDESDPRSREEAVAFLEQLGYYLKTPLSIQRERFKAGDFVIYNPKHQPFLIETERKKRWEVSGYWQGYPDIQVPYRKKDSKSTLFVMFNLHWNTLAVTEMKNVLEADPGYVPNIHCPDGRELFFKVDLEHFFFYTKTKKGRWKKINEY